jgi:hypothetical protein
MGKKREREVIDVDDVVESMNFDKGLDCAFLDLTTDEQAALLAHLANSVNLPNAAIKKARLDLPSFSAVQWSTFAQQYDLPMDAENLGLEPFSTPKYRLPPSFHQAMIENAWRWQDVYREKVDQRREEARVRLLQPVCEPNMDEMCCTD